MNMRRITCSTLAVLLGTAISSGPVSGATLATVVVDDLSGIPRLAIGLDGLPVILFAGLADLQLARCQDWACSSVSIQPLPGLPVTPDYALVIGPGGNPAIAFRDPAVHDLKFVRCTAADCSGPLSPIRTIEGGGASQSGFYVDVALGPDGTAAFAYMDAVPTALKLARCTVANCSVVDIQTLGPAGVQSGLWPAIAFGGPADPIVSSQWINTVGDAGVRRYDCTTSPCNATGVSIHYQVGEFAGTGQSMALLDDDTPVFAFAHDDFNAIYYGRCFDPACAGRYAGPVDDGTGAAPFSTRTAVAVRAGNRPVIAYRRDADLPKSSSLQVIECGNHTCTQRTSVTIEQSGSKDGTGSQPDIAIDDDGAVVIAYVDVGARAIRLARCSPETCAGPADRLFADGFD